MNDDPQRRALHNDSIETGENINIPPSWHFHLRQKRKKCRYLVVPKTERDLCALEDAYCDDNDGHQKKCGPLYQKSVSSYDTFASSSQRSSRRLLPSTQILISAMNETTSKRNTNTTSTSITRTRSSVANRSLLLRKFYESISVGIKDHSGNSFTVTTSARPMKEKENFTSDKTQTQQLIDEIDDCSFSTLKIGHHKRYLQLTTNNSNRQQTSKRTPAQRKELGKLNQMILKEQALYRLALDKFHDGYKSRYLIGFGSSSSSSNGNKATDGKTSNASAFGRWACFQAQAINREWEKTIEGNAKSTDPKTSNDRKNASINTNKNNDTHDTQPLPKYYGKVRQTFALHSRTQRSTLDVQDLKCYVVYESMPTSQLSSSSSLSSPLSEKIKEFSPKDAENSQDSGTFRKIAPPTTDSAPSVRLLRNDPKALELAAKYSATIVTTSETLETLLRLPGDRSSKWMLPCTTTRTVTAPNTGPESTSSSSIPVTILDLPIAQAFSSPRSCLETGLQEGLYQAFLNQQYQPAVETSDATQNGKEKQDGTSDGKSPPVSQFVYSLWTLPTKNVGVKTGSRKATKVIVRTLVRLRDSVSKLPVRLRARVEYFSTPVNSKSRSRREIPNSYEKSLWILDQVLFEHQVFCLQYRIDPTTCGIVGWDATSVAHAFAASATDDIPGGFKSHHNDHGPLDHWKALIQLLQSIPSIDVPETLLCLPGRIGERNKIVNDTSREILLGERTISTVPTDFQTQQQQEARLDPFSVSVHAPCEDLLASRLRQSSPSPSSTVIIALDESVLDQVGAVILGDQALRDCRREWEWGRPGQVPNTYPIDTME